VTTTDSSSKDRDVTAQLAVRGDVAVLVPAAGMGVRLGGGIPKALRLLGGEPLLVHAVRRIAAVSSVGAIVVAGPPGGLSDIEELLRPVAPVTVVPGGDSRHASVVAALAAVPAPFDIVLVHDAARCLAPADLFEAVAGAVREGCEAVVPVLPVVDTIKRVGADGVVLGTVDRGELRAVQTPQGFRRAVLAAAHRAAGDDHTDDAGLVERLGVKVHTVPGEESAMKITRPLDLVVADALLQR
jgi:2-C-methyl-D-erythritol 4-phosphate cytidylyltransferase